MKKVLVVAATQFEIQPFIHFLSTEMRQKQSIVFRNYEFDVLITGVGMVNTALKLTKRLTQNTYDIALNAGVAGSFIGDKTTKNPPILRGAVVEVVSEQYGDLGVEEADGRFTDMFELGLIKPDESPYKKSKLLNLKPLGLNALPRVSGLTVQKVHGFEPSIEAISKKYDCQIETMEGAAFFQTCLTEGIAFTQIRAISNFVESRNRDNWKMQEAIQNLNEVLIELFEKRLV
ncbi:MAG: futalosine hydrolase [Saprospiraceae bacterium]|nr:futalosine hydrolase [Saprospiraceae bacterium]